MLGLGRQIGGEARGVDLFDGFGGRGDGFAGDVGSGNAFAESFDAVVEFEADEDE